jgi:hypothetical protein
LPLANLDKAIAELSVADANAGGGVDVKPPPLAREAVPGVVDLGVLQRQPQINCPPAGGLGPVAG